MRLTYAELKERSDVQLLCLLDECIGRLFDRVDAKEENAYMRVETELERRGYSLKYGVWSAP